MMRYEIINPHDEAYMESGSHKHAAIAALLLGQGYYALREVDGDFEMPIMFLGGVEEWFKEKFGMTFSQIMDGFDKTVLIPVLESVKLTGEQSSITDFVSRAHAIAGSLVA